MTLTKPDRSRPASPDRATATESYRQPGSVLTDHTFRVPLDHDNPGGPHITLFAREVVGASDARQLAAGTKTMPWLLYLTGGPGYGAPRPIGRDRWLDRALREYRVLLLDQRGTGLSTPVNRQTLARRGDAAAQAAYLSHFRADSIVRDAELVRRAVAGSEPWTVLGQSFGGFCTVTYLSFAPEGIREAIIAGGLPSLDYTADDIYRAAYRRVLVKNAAHFERYPADLERATRIADYLRNHEVRLPGGAPFTVALFQSLGMMLGTSTGSHRLHYLLENAFIGGMDTGGMDTLEMSEAFLHDVQAEQQFAAAPLYALLHEACYAQFGQATRWAAQRIRAEFAEFDAVAAQPGRLLFTGEMIYPWMFEHDPALRPLWDTARLLAERDTWPDLYDVRRLRANDVPVAAVVYYDDMYVDREHSLQTARQIRGLRPWVTNEYEHDGLRMDGSNIVDRLIARARGNT